MRREKVAIVLIFAGCCIGLIGGFGSAWIRFTEGLGALGGGTDPSALYWNSHPLRWAALRGALWLGIVILIIGLFLLRRTTRS